jgi:hypothetical protein
MKVHITTFMAGRFKARRVYPRMRKAGMYEITESEASQMQADCEWQYKKEAWPHLLPAVFATQCRAYKALWRQIERAR